MSRIDEEEIKAVGDLVDALVRLAGRKDIPDNPRRDLNDQNILRLMSPELKELVTKVKMGVYAVGFEADSRGAVVALTKLDKVSVKWIPSEQDSCGWLSAKLVTSKGFVSFA